MWNRQHSIGVKADEMRYDYGFGEAYSSIKAGRKILLYDKKEKRWTFTHCFRLLDT